MILNALALKLERQARGDFKGRHCEATLIVQAVSWYLRDALNHAHLQGRGLRTTVTPARLQLCCTRGFNRRAASRP
ncbi:hypothetical protein Mnod_8176 (plasmid) [Methylobacterium nodulans ORS 2060]|uniref:Transposase n=1 Tax=Methylobacterium nodulans (strain LMG 21967 / CNCM I-2342 / ORS 2060) TaxID=460265 RepID=B8IXB1_METNO|nr:hypothetical protein Mnod_8176 [Methylobacterium nodulans ORS 2060]